MGKGSNLSTHGYSDDFGNMVKRELEVRELSMTSIYLFGSPLILHRV